MPSRASGCAGPKRSRRSATAPWSSSTPRAGSPPAAGGHHRPPTRTRPTAGRRASRPGRPSPTRARHPHRPYRPTFSATRGEGDGRRCPIGRPCPDRPATGGRQAPLRSGVLMVALNERLTDAYKLLPPAGWPGPEEGDAGGCGSWSAPGAPPAPPAAPGHYPLLSSRNGSRRGRTAARRPPTRPESGGWGRRSEATPPRGSNEPSGAGLGLAGGSWRQEQAQVTVGNPGRAPASRPAGWGRAGPLPPPRDGRCGIRLPGPTGDVDLSSLLNLPSGWLGGSRHGGPVSMSTGSSRAGGAWCGAAQRGPRRGRSHTVRQLPAGRRRPGWPGPSWQPRQGASRPGGG
jgi:hypothetical protein